MSKKRDNHGAAKAGTKSEDILKLLFKSQGLQLLNKKSEFEKAGLDMNGRKYLKKPSWWHEKCLKTPKKGDEAIFKSDGYVDICGGLIIELKSSNNHGTTEEKVFYDLEKIRDGVYGKQHKLIYAFVGDVCDDVGEYHLFKQKAEREGLPVHITFGWDELEKLIIKFKGDE